MGADFHTTPTANALFWVDCFNEFRGPFFSTTCQSGYVCHFIQIPFAVSGHFYRDTRHLARRLKSLQGHRLA